MENFSKDETSEVLHVPDEFKSKRRQRWKCLLSRLLINFDDDPTYEYDNVDKYDDLTAKEEYELMKVNAVAKRSFASRSFNISASFVKSNCNPLHNSFTFTMKKRAPTHKRRKAAIIEIDDQNGNTKSNERTITSSSNEGLLATKCDRERAKPKVMLNLPIDNDFFGTHKENLFAHSSSDLPPFPTFKFDFSRHKSSAPSIRNQLPPCSDDRKKTMTVRERNVRSFLSKLRLNEDIDRIVQLFRYIEDWDKIEMRSVALQKRWLELKNETNDERYSGVMKDYCREFCKLRCRLPDDDIKMYVKFVLYMHSSDLCDKLRKFQCGVRKTK